MSLPAPAATTAEDHGPEGAGERGAPAIQAVDRAAAILAAFTPQRPYLTLNEITAILGTSKATAHRYTKALRSADLLRYDPRESVYSLGPQLMSLAAAARAALPVVKIAEPFMEKLVRKVDETVVLSVWDGESPIVVATNDSTDRIARVSVRLGARLSPTASAQGRVFCAYLSPEELPMLSRELRADPELALEIETIRESHVSVKSPIVNGLRTVAAPVFQADRVVAALAVIAASTSVPADEDSAQIRELTATARDLSAALGRS
ncbi:IclR family transcriptional regulator [Pseudonocardia pini]|uniref:IclR family transcriptional regulator n=1 Tax=Pseudonocardia pini TaxID=2758030 RepID=UPI0015F065C8|nr:IclR family transcriptional regulator [Pseudonocardia pini]